MDQRSPEWFAERAGKLTASKIADMMARTKTGWGASRANYAAQLVAERLTGTPTEGYCSPAMQWGVDNEAAARDAYCQHMLCAVEEVGFVPHPTIEQSGASPDGLVGVEGLIEIKCPGTATHIDTLLNGAVADKYVKQMQWQMACTGRAWCDFASYDPRMPEAMRLWVKRVDRDDALIAELEREARAFLTEIEETVARLLASYGERIAA